MTQGFGLFEVARAGPSAAEEDRVGPVDESGIGFNAKTRLGSLQDLFECLGRSHG